MEGRQLKQGGVWTPVETTAGVLRNGDTPTPVLDDLKAPMTGKKLREYNLNTVQQAIDKALVKMQSEIAGSGKLTIPVPVIFKPGPGGLAIALTADMVNMLVVNNTCIIPKPFGPVHPPGQDLFWDDLEEKLKAESPTLTLKPVDDWYTYHAILGEIHCGTNVNRSPSDLGTWLGSEAAEWWRFKG
jgi:protein-arginine deiminase